MQAIEGHLYDYPSYYDLVYGSDWKAEYDFLRACFDRYARSPVWRVLEPACGTGRLLYRLGKAGFTVSGVDLNSKAIDYCNARLKRHGLPETARVGDMSDFRLPRKVDAAFNLVSSFRHLPTQNAARAHLQCVARALARGGIYILGFHLTPTTRAPMSEERWSARRGQLAVLSHLETVDLDRRKRQEHVDTSFDVYTPRCQFRLVDQWIFRTYTAVQFRRLLADVPELEVLDTFDFAYEIDHPLPVTGKSEDVVWVLGKR